MEKQLRNALNNYRVITVKLIEALETEDFDALEGLLLIRQDEIVKMNKMTYTKDEFTDICNEFQVLRLQQKLTILMNTKKYEAKSRIDKFKEVKSANESYNKRFNVDSIYFNKKI